MSSGKEIKSRIKSVKNTQKITKAMELVSASKMKRSVNKAHEGREYAKYSWETIMSIKHDESDLHKKYFEQRNANQKHLLVVITSNRGLCGSYNSAVIKESLRFIKEKSDLGQNVELITIGKKGANFFSKNGFKIIASFEELNDVRKERHTEPISEFIINKYDDGIYDSASVCYTKFKSSMAQVVTLDQVLPLHTPDQEYTSFQFEPSYEEIMPYLVNKTVKYQIYQMILESAASEHSQRMIAMKNAGDSAKTMIDELTNTYNKTRQASITQEISEISAGVTSMN